MYDRLSDLARVLRIAGTQNHKDPANPKDVTVFNQTDRFYNLSDFEEFLDDAQIPDPEEEERAAREWKERFADKPLAYRPERRHPPGDARRVDGPEEQRPQFAGVPEHLGTASGTT